MIDTDKYEGYSEDEWILVDDKYIVMNIKTGNVASFDTRYVKISQPDMNLILDAPLLLQEVKRLNMVINMLRKNDLWVSTELWEESDKDDELLVSIHFLIDKALELRGDFND